MKSRRGGKRNGSGRPRVPGGRTNTFVVSSMRLPTESEKHIKKLKEYRHYNQCQLFAALLSEEYQRWRLKINMK